MVATIPRKGEVPQCAAAERLLLGAVLVNEEQVWSEQCATIVDIDDFFVPEHRAIWTAMLRLRIEHTPITMLTLPHMLEQMDYLRYVDELTKHDGGTEPYLVGILGECWAATGCSAHARMVADYAERRRLLEAGIALINDAQQTKRTQFGQGRTGVRGQFSVPLD